MTVNNIAPIQNSLGARGELCLEASLSKNRILVVKYGNGNNQGVYIADVYKEEETQLLVALGAVTFLKSVTKLTLDHYGVREAGVSGFIKSQVTGEAFVMTEVRGAGNIRLRPCANLLHVSQYQNTKFCLPNINIAYVQAILGSFEISSPQKTKSAIPINYSEIKLHNALVLVEAEEFYEVSISPGNPLEIEAGDVVFWTGDISIEEIKDAEEGNLVKFAGIGNIYLSLSV